ncbi:hypothetical protein HGRIS_008645 [Hohenbuehelia grisea]|uniref:N-glycosylation protein EOS1 n=1 Tax=Hohenbuehelia grisea TaxID=104357 RepID=A0ABR3J8J1_9AGAR
MAPSNSPHAALTSNLRFPSNSRSVEHCDRASPNATASAYSTRQRSTRRRASSNASSTFSLPSKFLITPASSSPPHTHQHQSLTLVPPPPKSRSTPALHRDHAFLVPPPPYIPSSASSGKPYPHRYMEQDSGSDDDREDRDRDEDAIYTSWRARGGASKPSMSLRARLLGGVLGAGASSSHASHSSYSTREPKLISTTPGMLGAGETETEADEPPRRLPTSRIIPPSSPLIPHDTLQHRLTPLLFEFSRLLSIVPALLGTLYNLYYLFYPPQADAEARRAPPESVDFFVAALWSLLTGHQCLALTTGLLTRWRLYYPPLSTLIRLLALQSICWPATHFTLQILNQSARPVVVWALIGTTTSVSRAVQLWVTSNLWWEESLCDADHGAGAGPDGGGGGVGAGGGGGAADTGSANHAHAPRKKSGYWKRSRWRGGKWGGRHWDWREVGVKCVLPAGAVYVVMAWAEALRRELRGC